ncbi:hypothetical protein [Caballeronia sp. AZ10_KS36]|uniref:hypothetical protein n=1 Tax=Caballeronia sp. AZ10_KS36 TaxID=2921757 RepID=UPI0020296B61|nr:hypothetical protein [Caballeronia sp. AZ10_KS36]
MASAVDICNLALGHLGDDATVSSLSPPEGSAQAEHCARFYPIARDLCLESHEWGFATRRADLALLADTPPPGFQFVYAMPSNCRNIIDLVDPVALDDYTYHGHGEHWRNAARDPVPYELETRDDGTQVIYTNLANAKIRYVYSVTDTTKFSAQFVDALAWLLAAYLAGPIIKGDTGMQVGQAMLRAFTASISQAKTSDANNRRRSRAESERNPSWIASR